MSRTATMIGHSRCALVGGSIAAPGFATAPPIRTAPSPSALVGLVVVTDAMIEAERSNQRSVLTNALLVRALESPKSDLRLVSFRRLSPFDLRFVIRL